MDDIRDQMDLANEISEAISQPVGIGADFDEEELNQELEELEQLEFNEQVLDTGLGANLEAAPSVPSTIPGYFR
jgi:charged multivesicular body protein 4